MRADATTARPVQTETNCVSTCRIPQQKWWHASARVHKVGSLSFLLFSVNPLYALQHRTVCRRLQDTVQFYYLLS
ncbi:hypothetical protein CSUI_005908 [Cystoisospora suis]|uniref:Uncharacterized protein n=1 Tax=Cystoisospora suis TaxID=483139 RepID=A0A2C6KTK7_9APIC|nr:hypothetical protein CSUI_005908 [Cystoisospora suis]